MKRRLTYYNVIETHASLRQTNTPLFEAFSGKTLFTGEIWKLGAKKTCMTFLLLIDLYIGG